MAAPIMLDELLAEVERLTRRGPTEGYTVRELAAAWGVTLPTARQRLDRLQRKGCTIRHVGYRWENSLDGRMLPRPVYAIERPKKRR